MLHIILFVLKILGWILLAVLGLLVLMFLLALFTPLRYQAGARCKGKLSALEAGVRFHIFFHLVSGNLCYEEQKLTWNVRAAWIKLGNSRETEESEETVETDEDKSSSVKENLEETPVAAEVPDSAGQKPEEADEMSPKDQPEKGSDAVKGVKEAGEDTQKKISSGPEETESSGQDSLADKIASVFEKIKYTFSRICDKIKALWKKAEDIKAFLENDTHKSAFWKLAAELKKLLFRMRPKQVEGNVGFGFEDPSLTGRAMAGLSMLCPYWEVRLYPDFERKVLDGSVLVKGSARLWPAAVLAWNLLWNRDVRRTVMDIKKMVFK